MYVSKPSFSASPRTLLRCPSSQTLQAVRGKGSSRRPVASVPASDPLPERPAACLPPPRSRRVGYTDNRRGKPCSRNPCERSYCTRSCGLRGRPCLYSIPAFDPVPAANIFDKIEKRRVCFIIHGVWVLCVACNLDRDCAVIVRRRRTAPRTIGFIDVKPDPPVVADPVV